MTVTDTKAALLRAVCENPGDDLPRLAYADWLEEQGDTVVSTYIRLAIEKVNLPWNPERIGRYKHAWESLRVAIDARLTNHVPHCVNEMIQRDGERNAWFMDRGFLTSIVCPMKWFMESAIRFNDIFRVCPIVKVTSRDRRPAYYLGRDAHDAGYEWEAMMEYLTPRMPCQVSRELFDRASGMITAEGRYVRFPTERDANDALSRACVNYGRRMAGLPPLPPLPKA